MSPNPRLSFARRAATIGSTAAFVVTIPFSGERPVFAAFPGANGKIAFTSVRQGIPHIFVINPDGSGEVQLTTAPSRFPAWSPDGTKIAFVRGDNNIVVMNPDGSGEVQLTTTASTSPAWSPDGTKIAFQRGGKIFVMNADGSQQTQLLPFDGHPEFNPAWSPDGTKIAFESSRGTNDCCQIWLMNADGTGAMRLTTGGDDFEAAWSPDGTKIAFHSQVGVGLDGRIEIFVVNADGSGRAQVTQSGAGVLNLSPAWSPDGTKIAFMVRPPDVLYTNLFVMHADGTGATQLTQGAVINLSPDWQPTVASSTITWSMPDRYDTGNNQDGPIVWGGTPKVRPAGFQVDFSGSGDACGGVGVSATAWVIEGVTIGAEDPNVVGGDPTTCTFSYRFPLEGTYEVTLEGRSTGGEAVVSLTDVVPVQDFLIVSIGDSVASGEGNPDDPGVFATWQNEQCHRSPLAGPARAAKSIEQADPRTAVTFAHLACSGATINEGLLGAYDGIEPGTPLLPQVDAFADLAGDREVDAVVVSIGANDVKFAHIVEECLLRPNCNVVSPGSAAFLFKTQFSFLPGRYGHLNTALDSTGRVKEERVYITEYFDPTTDDAGAICDRSILADWSVGPFGVAITAQEAFWASTGMIASLNGAIHAATNLHGWNYVGNIASRFFGHGYCATDHWVVRFLESSAGQGDRDGTLHPNTAGQVAYGTSIGAALTGSLYTGGSLKMPRRPEQRLEVQGQRATGGGFLDVVTSVEPGEPVTIRVRLNGPDNASRAVSVHVDGPGSLDAGSGLTDANGEATFTYTAPDPFDGKNARVVATIADFNGTFSDTVGIGLRR